MSPAHVDRGDGLGERDYVYIGKYACSSSNYKSVSGVKPVVGVAMATNRTSIHSLGSTIWQMDFRLLCTIYMLYLVEFANWDSQRCIGAGGNTDKVLQNTGSSDITSYHTGTAQATRDTYGVGCKYRNIEGLWENVHNYVDGYYHKVAGSSSSMGSYYAKLYILDNPSEFGNTTGGTYMGYTHCAYSSTDSGKVPVKPYFTSAASYPGLFTPYMAYGDETWGDDSTYTTDAITYAAKSLSSSVTTRTWIAMSVGGSYGVTNSMVRGLFNLNYDTAATYAGCRLMKLP